MRHPIKTIIASASLALASSVSAQTAKPSEPPRLIVAISVDQLSADLFAQYRRTYTDGLARLQQGAVFPSAFQAHAATETCPGHATLLTGVHPARSGIIANNWFQPSIGRADKKIYCAEDSNDPASTSGNPIVSASHLRVPTLGDRLKVANPASRNVAVSAKDRSVIMMGGHTIDAAYWWKGGAFTSFPGTKTAPAVVAVNAAATALIAKGGKALPVPKWCEARQRSLTAGKVSYGSGRFVLERGKADQFRLSPRMDDATADLAIRLTNELSLGKGPTTDMLSVSFSATDYIGHAFGSEGLEMCIQMAALDRSIGKLLANLDARKIDYVVVLSADHGGLDATEGLQQQAYPGAVRVDPALLPAALGAAVSASTGIKVSGGPMVYGDGPFGDLYLSEKLTPAEKAKATSALAAILKAHPQVAAVFTAKELSDAPLPSNGPQDWSLRDRARASFDPQRSGDVIMLLDRAVMPIPAPGPGYVATHGSAWDYDRRVPLLFWRKGMQGFEQPAPVETVDIAPTLTAVLGLRVPGDAYDGRCLDLDGGPANSCEVVR
jgi:predicted AlkP superfamily pyrophosphatase or phosphodiesterase